MDALNILALGLAAKGGGGGGTTYTAGKNIDITNDEISLEETVTLGTNPEEPELDVTYDYNELNDTSAKIETFELSEQEIAGTNYEVRTGSYVNTTNQGITVNSEQVISDLEIPLEYGTININDKYIYMEQGEFDFDAGDLVTSAAELSTEDNKLLVNGEAVALESDIPEAELPEIQSGDAGKVLTVNSLEDGVEWAASGGGSAGAVRYDEAQSLTDAEKNQAKANQDLPYISFTKTLSKEDYAYTAGTGAQTVSISTQFSNIPSPAIVGSKVYLYVRNGDSTFEESVTGTFTNTSGNFAMDEQSDAQYFDTSNTNNFIGANQLVFNKKDTSEVVSGTTYFSAWVDVPSYNNRISKDLINSDLLSNVRTVFNTNPTGWLVVQPDTTNANYKVNVNNFVVGSRNRVDTSNGACVIGNSNKAYSNTNPYALIGYGNETNGTAPNVANFLIGNYLKTTQSNSATVIGKYNLSTSKYEPWNANTVYNQGDCVTRWQTNHEPAVYRCLADDTSGYSKIPPSSGTGSNTYWEYVDGGTGSSYLFVIGNGSAGNARSNALTVDWSGNLVCNNIPAPPAGDGTYNLQCTISSGVATYTWVAQV